MRSYRIVLFLDSPDDSITDDARQIINDLIRCAAEDYPNDSLALSSITPVVVRDA